MLKKGSFVLENRHAQTFKLEKSPRTLKLASVGSRSHHGGTKHSLYKKQSLYVINKSKSQSPKERPSG